MAFGFLKKLVAKLTGKSADNKNGANQQGGKKGRHRGRRGGRGRHGDGIKNGDETNRSQQPVRPARDNNQGGNRNDRGQRNDRNRNGRNDRQGDRQNDRRNDRNNDRNNNRNDRGPRNDRGRNGRGNDRPKTVNTAANEMRPGGVMTPEQIAKLREEHAAWDPASFVVEAVEGKKRFHDFNLPSEIMHGIADLGFQYCTEIQARSLDFSLAGKNVAGKALTGSGKTAAFLVAILTRYLRTPEGRAAKGGQPRALVIAPTRELVIQICKDAHAIGKYCGLRSLAVYGGMDLERQSQEILSEPVDLLVATPGRLLDFCKRRVVDLSRVDTMVIDEADRMLDMGFIPDVKSIMYRLPPKDKRATMLYSATLNDDVMNLASQWMDEPVRVELEGEQVATDTVRQVVYICRAEDKFKMLFNHIALHPDARTIVFCNRKSTTEDVFESLKCRGVSAEMLSGDVNQNKRLRVLEDFRAGKIKIVIATDVAGRGIHVDDIEYVVNFDFPYEAEDYVHRIGRTGRAGNTGIAISFADEDESFAIPDIEAYIQEPLKCTMIQDDDPLLKELPKRGTDLGEVDAEAKAAVDAREAVTEEQKRAAAQITGIVGKNAAGKESIIRTPPEDAPLRKLPTFENALEPKAKPKDESNIYSKPVDQKTRYEEWTLEAPTAEAKVEENAPEAPAAEAAPAPETSAAEQK